MAKTAPSVKLDLSQEPTPSSPAPPAMPAPEDGDPTDAILILIDVVGYTPQARQAGGPAVREFDAHLKEEITSRAGDKVYWIKSIGDAALLWCEKPAELLEFVLALFASPIEAKGEFKPGLRVLAHKDYFTFSQDAHGTIVDVHGVEAIILFRLEKTAHVNRLVVTNQLFNGLRHLLTRAQVTYHQEQLPQELKGVGADSPRHVFILRPPVHDANRDHELPKEYLHKRTQLQQDVQTIPVFGNLYDPIPMRENFLHLTLDLQRTAVRGMYFKWDYPDLRRRMETDRQIYDVPDLEGGRFGGGQSLKADDLFDHYATAVIAGLPGAGKTTILRHFAWRALEDNPHAIVIYIEAKHLHMDHLRFAGYPSPSIDWYRLLAALFLQPGTLPAQYSEQTTLSIERLGVAIEHDLKQQRRAIILLDALDEGSSPEVRKALALMSNELMSTLPAGDATEHGPGFKGRCYLSLRAAELDEHSFTATSVFLVNPLDLSQIRQIAKRRLREETAEYARFDDQIWRRTDVLKIAGTPLTAMLMVFFFEVHGRFARRYATYRLMVLFVLDRAWQRLKAHQFGPSRGGLNPFFHDVQEPDYLEKNPELARQLGALAYVARRRLYHADKREGDQHETERSVSRQEFRELLKRWLSQNSAAPKESDLEGILKTWIEFWRQENILLPSGRDRWVFLHSTVLEFLAAESTAPALAAGQDADVRAVFDEATRDHLETLPILCSADDPIPCQVLARLKPQPGRFTYRATLPFRCLVEAENVDREFLSQFEDPDIRLEKEVQIQSRTELNWAYDRIAEWIVNTPGNEETEKVKFLDERVADLKGLMPLPRDVLVRRLEGLWQNNGSSLARKQVELLNCMLAEEVRAEFLKQRNAAAPNSAKDEPYLAVLSQFRGAEFAASVRALKTRTGSAADRPLDFDQPGHRLDTNLAYFRREYTERMLGFLGSPNFRMGGAVTCLAISFDGKLAVSGSDDASLTLWNLGSGRAIRDLQGHQGSVLACTFSPDGRHVLSSSGDRSLKLWHVKDGSLVHTLQGHEGFVRACAFHPDGFQVLSGSDDKTLKLWDVAAGKHIHTFRGHQGAVLACAFSPDGCEVLSGSDDKTLKRWDVASRKLMRTFQGHLDYVKACAFSPDGLRILSGSGDDTAKIWEVAIATANPVRTLRGHQGHVLTCAFSPDGRHVLSGSDDKTLKLWDAASGNEVRCFLGHQGYILACAFTPDGSRILSGADDNTLKLWDAASGKELFDFHGQRGSVWACAFSPNGRRVLSSSSDKTLKLWDTATGKFVRELSGHKGFVWTCAFSPDGGQILSGSSDNTLKLWNTAEGKEVRTFAGHHGSVLACAFSPDGRKALSGSADKSVRLWDASTSREVRTFTGHLGSVLTCAFSPDGQRVLSGSDDKTLNLWNVTSGEEVRAFAGHQGPVLACAFSANGQYVLSGSRDTSLILWDAVASNPLRAFKGHQIRAFMGHRGSVLACTFSPDGEQVLSGSDDKTLKLWDTSTGWLLQSWRLPSIPRWISFDPTRPNVVALALSMGVVALLDISRPAEPATLISN